MDYQRRCAQCGEVKHINDYYGPMHLKVITCKPCYIERSKAYIAAHQTLWDRMRRAMRSVLRESVLGHHQRGRCHYRIMSLIGCTPEEFEDHMREQYQEGMTDENYGTHWWIDHKVPRASFDMANPEEVRACFHWTNCQPLTKQQNLDKGGRILPDIFFIDPGVIE